jgi:hypothetical protein
MLCLRSLSLTWSSSFPLCLTLTGDELGGEEETEGTAVMVVSGANFPIPEPKATVETPF